MAFPFDDLMAKTIVDGFLEVRDICNEAQGLGKWPRPIPVGERLPETNEEVLCFYSSDWDMGRYNMGRTRWEWHSDETGWEPFADFVRVTHWLPLPPKPE